MIIFMEVYSRCNNNIFISIKLLKYQDSGFYRYGGLGGSIIGGLNCRILLYKFVGMV